MKMEHEFPFGIFRPEKQDYLFRCSVAPGNFPLGRPKKSCSIYFRTGFPGKFLSKGQIPGRARLKERLSRSKSKQAFLNDSDAELFIRLMKSSASEPGLRIHLVMATTNIWISRQPLNSSVRVTDINFLLMTRIMTKLSATGNTLIFCGILLNNSILQKIQISGENFSCGYMY